MRKLGFNVFFCALGFGACFLLQNLLNLSGIIASCLVAIGSFFFNKEAKAALYSGSFSAIALIEPPVLFYFLPIIQGGLLSILDRFFIGFGGKLGTIAFISFGLFYLIEVIK